MLESRLPTEKLGLTPQALSRVIHEFCEDLMLASSREWTGSARLDPRTRAMLLAEITDPLLQAEVLALCEEVVAADGHVADSESAFIETLRAAWTMAQAGLPRSTIHDPAGVL